MWPYQVKKHIRPAGGIVKPILILFSHPNNKKHSIAFFSKDLEHVIISTLAEDRMNVIRAQSFSLRGQRPVSSAFENDV